jgi:hypothetical protein
MHHSLIFRIAGLCALSCVGIAHGAQAQTGLKFRGSVHMANAQPGASSEIGLEFRQGPEEEREFKKQIRGSISPSRVPAAHVPTPADKSVSLSSLPTAFNGLTHADQRLAENGNQFSIEPPDQGLAVSDKYILEAVNLAIRVRSREGAILTPARGLNAFFNLAPAILRTTPPVYGPFVSDPKCYFDTATSRWFVTVLEIDTNPATGDLLGKSSVLIAVSKTADPTGEWNLYSLDTTNKTGTADHPDCPCFGDQPLIGADANGFYISTNEFPIFGNGFNGAQLYAISKAALVAGPLNLPTVVSFSGLPLADGPAYTLQPAITAAGGPHASLNGGTEYFLSALDFTATLDNRIAVWALTNTSSLNSATPQLRLQSAVLDSQVYGQPPDAQQRPGPLPLADLIFSGALGKASREHLPLLAANDDRMQQVTFAAGKLWSSLNTVVKPENGPVRVGAAYFVVTPTWTGTTLGGVISQQGYVSLSGNNMLFPSVGVNKNGKAIMSFTIVGEDYFPGVAYTPIDSSGAGSIRLVAPGAAPADGFTGYVAFGGRTERWGDYSAAVADIDGNIWFANEYIPNLPRTILANWGTFIGKIQP